MTKDPVALEKRRSEDGRLFSPSAGRNKADIASALSEMLPKQASVLEIGSGTGQHGIETVMGRSDVRWQFSDPDPISRASQSAWISHVGLDIAPPLNLNMSDAKSRESVSTGYDAVFSANMIHIAPISALEGLADLASKVLDDEGEMILYGPFLFEKDSVPSNLEFDASLRRRNSSWGVREIEFVKHIFAKKGFNIAKLRDMPKNNFLLGLSRH